MKSLTVILHNLRSTYNVGAVLRTCEGLGVEQVIFSGYTPYFGKGLPHEREKLRRQIHKTALGAEEMVSSKYVEDIESFIGGLKQNACACLALEQGSEAVKLQNFRREDYDQYALILGEEVDGVPPEILALADVVLEIPMAGQKESFNVAVAAGIAIWELLKP
jgi:tRNA G18 (ribose-2'-O)-methylase SpoU